MLATGPCVAVIRIVAEGMTERYHTDRPLALTHVETLSSKCERSTEHKATLLAVRTPWLHTLCQAQGTGFTLFRMTSETSVNPRRRTWPPCCDHVELAVHPYLQALTTNPRFGKPPAWLATV
jgi:hypothetical protein